MMLINFPYDSAECHKAMTVNCERKGYMILCLIQAVNIKDKSHLLITLILQPAPVDPPANP